MVHETQPPSTSLRDRVRGEASTPLSPTTLREPGRQIADNHLQAISIAVEAIAGKHLDELAERTGGLVAADQVQMRTTIEASIDSAIRRAWNTSPHTVPRDPNRPERNRSERLEVAS